MHNVALSKRDRRRWQVIPGTRGNAIAALFRTSGDLVAVYRGRDMTSSPLFALANTHNVYLSSSQTAPFLLHFHPLGTVTLARTTPHYKRDSVTSDSECAISRRSEQIAIVEA